MRRTTRLLPVPDVPGVSLQTGDDVMGLCRLAGAELGQTDPPLPFWAFPWAGGLALARYLGEHPEEVSGRTVVDLASGSGLCAIVALRLGAADALAIDVDPLAEAAVAVNARANGLRIGFTRQGIGAPCPPCDVILAGDVFYEAPMAERMLGWLRGAAASGVRVLIGDPGRPHLPPDLALVATYAVRTSLELEDAEVKPASVYTLPLPDDAA